MRHNDVAHQFAHAEVKIGLYLLFAGVAGIAPGAIRQSQAQRQYQRSQHARPHPVRH